MPISIYHTQTMVTAMQLMPPRPTFLRDRYFRTTDTDIFTTEDVLVEYKDEAQRKIAPAVIPLKGGIPVQRDGYKTDRITPPYIAPERPLSIDELNKKQFGETLFSRKKPAERAASILKKDLLELNELIDTREEWMAAQTLFYNGYSMKQYADKYGEGVYEEFVIHFYDGENNPAVYVPEKSWNTTDAEFLDDIFAMAMILKRRGLKATDLIMGAEVAATILKNDYLLKLLDNRSLQLAHVDPKDVPAGATSLGKVNVMGIWIEFLFYTEEFVDEDGKTKPFVPQGEVCLTTEKMGRTLYGTVTQLEKDEEFHSYAARRVPQVTSDIHGGVRTLTEKARPLMVPNFKNSAIKAKVLF